MPKPNGKPFRPMHAGMRLATVITQLDGMDQAEMEAGLLYLEVEERRALRNIAHTLNQATHAIWPGC